MSYDENRISDQIDGGLAQRDQDEEDDLNTMANFVVALNKAIL